jgi:hypothetical protein
VVPKKGIGISHISRPSARMMPASPILLTPCR